MLTGKCKHCGRNMSFISVCPKQLRYQLNPDGIFHGSVCVVVLDGLDIKNYYKCLLKIR
jgi:hypothetical protein